MKMPAVRHDGHGVEVAKIAYLPDDSWNIKFPWGDGTRAFFFREELVTSGRGIMRNLQDWVILFRDGKEVGRIILGPGYLIEWAEEENANSRP